MSIARRYPNRNRSRYQFPSYLKSMSKTKETRAVLKETSQLLGKTTHSSIRTVKEDAIHRYSILVQRDHEFAASLVSHAGLKKEHLKFLAGGELSEKDLKNILSRAEEITIEGAGPRKLKEGVLMSYHVEEDQKQEESEPAQKESEPDTEPEEEGSKQTSLFEF
jgi:hypothetical protein